MTKLILIGVLFLSILPCFALTQGEACNNTNANSCIQGTACVETPFMNFTNPRWGGLAPSDIKTRMNAAKEEYNKDKMPDMYDYLKTFTAKAILDLRIQKHWVPSHRNSNANQYPKYYQYDQKTETYSCYNSNDHGKRACSPAQIKRSKNCKKNPNRNCNHLCNHTCTRTVYHWKPVETFITLPSGSAYQGKYMIKAWSKKNTQTTTFTVKNTTTAIEVRHILGYYYQKLATQNETYSDLMKDECTGTQADIDTGIVEECEQTYQIMDEIVAHLDSYRMFQVNHDYRAAKVQKMNRGGGPMPTANYCYSLQMNSEGICKTAPKMCNCAMEGSKRSTIAGKTQQCCQPLEEGTLPIVPDNSGTCSAGFIPASPYGPNGNNPHYTIHLVGDIESGKSAPASCDIVYKFNDVTRLRDRELISDAVASNPTGDENYNTLISALRRYINNDWMITLVMEFLFSTSKDGGCLKPNFKGKRGSPDGHKFTHYMSNKVGIPLMAARRMGDSSFQSMIEQGINLQNELLKSSEQRDDITVLALTALIQKEKSMLGFENALLFGNGKQEPLMAKDISSMAGINIPLRYNNNTTWFNRLKDGYHDLKYNWWYAKRLGYGFWHRGAHRFKCTGMWWKEQAQTGWERAYKIKGTWSWFQRDWFLDPPIPTSMENIGSKSNFFCRQCRKASQNDIKDAFKIAIPKYFKDSISFDEDGNSNSFIKFTDPDRILNIMSDYSFKIFKWYSKRSKKQRHPVSSRMDTFYPTMETVLEELGHYLNEMTAVRAKKINCLNQYKASLMVEMGKGGFDLKTNGVAKTILKPVTILDENVDKNKLEAPELKDNPAQLKNSMDILKRSINPNANITNFTTDSVSTTSNLSASDSGNLSANESYRNAALNRSIKRQVDLDKTLKKLPLKSRKRLLQSANENRSESIKHYNKVNQSFGVGSYKGQSGLLNNQKGINKIMTATKLKNRDKNKGEKSTESTKTDDGSYSFLDIFNREESSFSDQKHTEAINPEAKKILTAIKNNKSIYIKNKKDGLFDIITKRYYRSAYPRLLTKKKKR